MIYMFSMYLLELQRFVYSYKQIGLTVGTFVSINIFYVGRLYNNLMFLMLVILDFTMLTCYSDYVYTFSLYDLSLMPFKYI